MDEVVEVAANSPRRLVERRHFPTLNRGHVLRQEELLDKPGNAQLLLDALALQRLKLLLPHQLRHAHRRRGLCRQIAQQAPVVGGVVLFAEALPQVDKADQLALAHQWQDEADTRGAQGMNAG